jgi:hypothetical protein
MEHKDCKRKDHERCKCVVCEKFLCSPKKDKLRMIEGRYVFNEKNICVDCWKNYKK